MRYGAGRTGELESVARTSTHIPNFAALCQLVKLGSLRI